ncbi:hypothetical protein V8D89_010337, partial [Ganoderma adspersum]
MTRYIVELNNYLQKQNQTHALHWGEEHIGPAGKKEWKMICNINGEAKGVGISAQKNAAKELAAKE